MTSVHNPYDVFSQRVNDYNDHLKLLKSRLKTLTISRLVTFLLSAVAVIYFLSENNGSGLLFSLIILVPLFVWSVASYQKAKSRSDLVKYLTNINQVELQRLEGNLKGLPQGIEYLDHDHPFSQDLDIFGSPSLYQLTNRTTTIKGEQRLVDSLLTHLPESEISARQETVKELSGSIELRQELQALGLYYKAKDEKARIEREDSSLLDWIKDHEQVNNKLFLKAFNLISPAVMIISMTLFPSYGYHLLFGFIFFHYGIMIGYVSKVNSMSRSVSNSLNLIKTYKEIILKFESQSMQSRELVELQSRLKRGSKNSAKILKQMENILQNFDNRANMIYWLLNGLFLLDLYWYIKAVDWKENYGELMLDWMNVAAEVEMLCSLGGFVYSHPDFTFPEKTESSEFNIESSVLGHPLIPEGKRVSNDFQLTGAGRIGLVTGSNMSGKSTFLRTVGFNIVLAQMGLPVCATKFNWAPINVYSGMRTQDDLGESVSSFYAELKRIRQLLELTETTSTFYLLDEILKGTNSDDRHKGAIALIEQLSHRSAFGLISTHDLALGKIEATNQNLKNYSFNSRLEDGDLIFDYIISDGICKSFNASVLMQKMGIIPQ
ncbi:MAG: hypothetical protein AAGC88_03050 [Bacteroidota bacterium]